MNGVVVATESLEGFDVQTVSYGTEVVHRVTVTGPVDLARRLPLYRKTLAANRSRNYFCVLDNSGGYENTLSLQDIELLDNILIDGGIENFYGVTISLDPSYAGIVKLANYSAETTGMNVELLATNDPAEAERFILERLEAAAP